MEISLHKLLYEVDLLEFRKARRTEDIEYGDNVLVVEVTEEAYLAQRAQAEHGVVERRNPLDRYFALRRYMYSGPAHLGQTSFTVKLRCLALTLLSHTLPLR